MGAETQLQETTAEAQEVQAVQRTAQVAAKQTQKKRAASGIDSDYIWGYKKMHVLSAIALGTIILVLLIVACCCACSGPSYPPPMPYGAYGPPPMPYGGGPPPPPRDIEEGCRRSSRRSRRSSRRSRGASRRSNHPLSKFRRSQRSASRYSRSGRSGRSRRS